MRTKIEAFTCCGDRRHVVLVERTDDEDFPVTVSLQGTPSSSLWQRLKDAYGLLLGKPPGGVNYPWDASLLSSEDVVRLRSLLEEVNEK